MAKKQQPAEYSRRLKKLVTRAGGADAYRSHLGFLPAGYHADPKKFAGGLNMAQKKRISRMHNRISGAGFNRIYGFTRVPKAKRGG